MEESGSVKGASSGTITVVAKDVRLGDPIQEFKFIVNEDNVGDPQVEIPEGLRDPTKLPSLKPGASHSPVVATGESSTSSVPVVMVPDGKYLVSVRAEGYKMEGTWVTVSGGDVVATVNLQPHPLPLSRIRVHVFHDNHPVNGEDDFPMETGLEGFHITIDDEVGEVTVDYFGNPIGTKYEVDQDGNVILDLDGKPVRIIGTGGKVLTDANGNAVIENIPPGKYGVQAIPPDGTDWIQTTTIEGTHVIDAWVEEGNDGYLREEGFRSPLVWIGFVKPMGFPPSMPWTTGVIKGRVLTIVDFEPPLRPAMLGEPIDRPWIALTDIGGNDEQVYTGRGDSNGNFFIENVPPSLYQMAIWDEPLDYIISFLTVLVEPGQTVDVGDIGLPRWYGYLKGAVFNDPDETASHGLGEPGIPNVDVQTRFKDGSIQYTTVTNMAGDYAFNEVFELERFAVAEVGFTRFARTGATAVPNYGLPMPAPTGCTDPRGNYVKCPETYPGMLTLAELTWAASTNRIDFGKRPYNPGENGGITGIVYYGTMRNELDPRYAVAEEYEPGVPGVTVNLYAASVNPTTGEVTQGALLSTVTTDAWQHPTGCVDQNGNLIPCLEIPTSSNQIRPGVFDGGYAFEPLAAGTYIVEVVPPVGYRILDENSVNTGEGDEFVPSPPVAAQAAARAAARAAAAQPERTTPGSLAVQMAPAPYYPIPTPPYYDPTKKVVTVRDGLNATADFFIFTDVPVPGRIVGWLLDDLNLETDPNRIYYGEKRGIPDTPIGIRDFEGRLIRTVYSDINGVFDVLLPSSYTRNVPTPSGVSPAMYRVIGNDPGDPDNPNANYNPNYQTLDLVFDVWPGKTTYADVAVFPVSAFVGLPGAQFTTPPLCNAEPGTPEIYHVDRVHVGPIGSRTVTITGKDFGLTPGTLTLDNVAVATTLWTDTSIEFDVPNIPGGPIQLLVKNSTGKGRATGITIHVLDATYNPPVINVPSVAYPTIQSAIDSAIDGSLIVVATGTYYESPILYKNVKLQGMGAHDTVIDGKFFASYAADWLTHLNSIDFDGPELPPPGPVAGFSQGQVVTVVSKAGAFSPSFRPQIDGFKITGARGKEAGGVYVHAQCRGLVISNNIIRSNGGGFGGGITIGKAYCGSNYNEGIRIHNNLIANNGGISLAGGIGVFNGADNYEIDHNEICGNYSGEYGGGISHYGLSNGGRIHHNCILFNGSFDEGAGVFIAGEQPTAPAVLTAGSGEVDIYNNMIKANVANDDGGGVRLLQPLDYRINIYNNFIVNNVSTDLGGGIALDDASNAVIFNNTIAKNITTATAEDSDGYPHAAGLVSEAHSAAFMATLPPGEPGYSDPVLFNNIFWDNRAGVFDLDLNGGRGGIAGIGAAGDPSPIRVMDLEVFATPALFDPEYCTLSSAYPAGSNNQVGNPAFVQEYDLEVTAVAFNMEPGFKSVKIVNVTPFAQGDYHLTAGSLVAIDKGTAQVTRIRGGVPVVYHAPTDDFDGETRPKGAAYDIGADEF
ncbi:MAG: pectin esterase [Firmicutes bacterium]|nr:pectin esterase [Bacillota bacterium]